MWKDCTWNLKRRMDFMRHFWMQRNMNRLVQMFLDSDDGGLLLHVEMERMGIQ